MAHHHTNSSPKSHEPQCLIAFGEYCFQVPANRLGYSALTLTQLKITQEVITLVVFTGFAFFAFDQTLKWNYLVSFLFIIGAVYFAFKG